jgi:hypothetical protein
MTHPNTTRLSSRLRLLCGLALLIGLCALTGGLTRPAHALSKLKVTTCSSDAQLQAEVAQANTDNASDVITFACSGDIKLSSTLKITGSMTLDGSGQSVTLDGGNSTQVLYVNNGVTFTLKALTIAHGVRALNALRTSTSAGGGLDNEGGTVTISNSTFSGNSASYGGGLENGYGTVSISNSTFSGNSAPGPAPTASGGGLDNFGGTLSISNSTFSGNSASGGQGGGLFNYGGPLSISNSTFSGNSASYGGGGLSSGGPSSISGSISNSTFSGNSASYGGGLSNGGPLSISNSTFSGNSASGGGGLFNNSNGELTISNSTIANNSAPSDGFGGGLFTFYGEVNIGGSIVAENTGGDCSNVDLGFGSYTDQGYNLTSDSSCGLAGTGSVQNTNPKLGPLASNGGRTQTMALLKGSPASDYIPLSSSLCPATDQRGHKRPDSPQESACDIGAYES